MPREAASPRYKDKQPAVDVMGVVMSEDVVVDAGLFGLFTSRCYAGARIHVINHD